MDNAIKNNQKTNTRPTKTRSKPQKAISLPAIITFTIGLIALIASLAFCIINMSKPKTANAEYLVEIGAWAEEESNSVVWNFTEIGKGTLTTNDHINDYEFTWSLEGNTLKVETDWLYTLENEYTYTINRSSNILTLTSGNKTIKFIPAEN